MKKFLLVTGLLFLIVLVPILFVLHARTEIYASLDVVEPVSVAIVFGAGIKKSGEPSDVLRDRLSVAADLYHRQKINTILVSGDNRFEDYSEPDVMRDTLVTDFSVPKEVIHVDYAGRRTYDTCIRAHELWGVEHAILVTQDFHLPRAIWTCSRLGIESTGMSATLRPYLFEGNYQLREWLAVYKAFIDLYFIEPNYIKGSFEVDLDFVS